MRLYKAIDPVWKNAASQGGVVRGCCDWLLRTNQVEGIVAVLNPAPGVFEYGITQDVSKLAKSVYEKVSLQNVLQGLDRENYCFVGLPCGLAKGFKFSIALFCHGTKEAGWLGEKRVLDYRFGVKTDTHNALLENGEVDRYMPKFLSSDRTNKECLTCRHAYTPSASMSVGDMHMTPYNLVIVRDERLYPYFETIRALPISSQAFLYLSPEQAQRLGGAELC